MRHSIGQCATGRLVGSGSGIERIDAAGVCTSAGQCARRHHRACHGLRCRQPLLRLGIQGRGGLLLRDAWAMVFGHCSGLASRVSEPVLVTGPGSPASSPTWWCPSTPRRLDRKRIAHVRSVAGGAARSKPRRRPRTVAAKYKLRRGHHVHNTELQFWYVGANVEGKPRQMALGRAKHVH